MMPTFWIVEQEDSEIFGRKDIDAFYRKYVWKVERRVSRMGIPADQVKCAANDGFLAVVRKWDSGEPLPDPRAYLFTVAIHAALKALRPKPITETPNTDLMNEASSAGRDLLTDFEVREDLRQVIERLAPRQREAVVLRYLYELSADEAAARAGISKAAIESNRRDGLRKMRQIMDGQDVDWRGEIL